MIKRLRQSLVTRVVALIFVVGFVSLVTLVILTLWLHKPRVLPIMIFIVVPLVIGWFPTRLVTQPLKRFNRAIESLQANDYKTELHPSGIIEFDRVFSNFDELTKRLEREEELRKDLISDTSHELNTPLAAITGQLTAMREGKLAISKERINALKVQTDRLVELVTRLDAYTKARMPDTGDQEDICVKQLCEQVLDELMPLYRERHVTTELLIPNDYMVHANRTALHQILTNLLQNALRYSGASILTVAANKRHLILSDNGNGVPVDSLPFLFERFYRVDPSRNRKTGGLGLGLAIVKELVRQQGWIIQAEAAEPGLTFVITFKP